MTNAVRFRGRSAWLLCWILAGALAVSGAGAGGEAKEAVAADQSTASGQASTKQVLLNGQLQYKLPGIVHDDTTYMPVSYVTQILKRAGINTQWTGTQWVLSTSGPANPVSYTPPSRNQTAIVLNGKLVGLVSSLVYQNTTYVPLWNVMNALRQLGFTNTWDGTTWAMLSPVKAHHILLGYAVAYTGQVQALEDIRAHLHQIQQMALFTYSVKANGRLSGTIPQSLASVAKNANIPLFVTVANTPNGSFDGKMMDKLLRSRALSAQLQQNIVNLVEQSGLDGVNLDFEMLPPRDRDGLTAFLSGLHCRLAAAGKRLTINVPAETGSRADGDVGAYDYAAIGRNTDEVAVMAYDYSYPGSPPGPVAPVKWVDKVLAYATGKISPRQILLGIPAYGYDWSGRQTRALALSAIDGDLKRMKIAPRWDSADAVPYYTYVDTEGTHTVYYENAQSLKATFQLADQYGVAGVAMWRLGLENRTVWNAAHAYQSGNGTLGPDGSAP